MRLSIVCETRVPSRTGNVSRIRPVLRASVIARAGSPRRAGRVADISTPIIVAEVTSRRRTGPVRQRRTDDPVPGRGAEEERERHQPAGDQHPGDVGADDAGEDVVDADFLRGEGGQADTEGAGDGEAGPAGDATATTAVGRHRGIRRGKLLRRQPEGGRRRVADRSSGRSLGPGDGGRCLDRALVDTGHLVGDPGPRITLRALAGGAPHRRRAARAHGGPAGALRRAAAGRPARRGRRRPRR